MLTLLHLQFCSKYCRGNAVTKSHFTREDKLLIYLKKLNKTNTNILFKLVEFIVVELVIRNAVIVMIAQHWQTDEWCFFFFIFWTRSLTKGGIFDGSVHNDAIYYN